MFARPKQFSSGAKAEFVIVLVLLLVIELSGNNDHEHDHEHEKKPELLRSPGFLNYYPANAVKADIPFPFGNGRTTVARASDFQLRHVIFSLRPSLL
jgi:hypothetical protein